MSDIPNTSTETSLTPIHWANAIKAKALELGFDLVGILNVDEMLQSKTFQGHHARLQDWLNLGYQADMEWMETHFHVRAKPEMVMENTRSIVCVAMNYFTEDPYAQNDPSALKIAKYARGTDYHDVVKQHLKKLLAWIQEKDPSISGRAVTDSAPIMEKPLAQMAGIGWQGKNGNIIHPQKGSFFFLGELMLSIPLPSDIPQPFPSCGNCTKCIDACPTDAILHSDTQYGVVDANRCISYWTIEYKGDSIPEEIRQNLNGWVFGCDICQDVCPWNIRFSTPTTEPLFQPRPWNIQPNKDEILSLDEETFREKYRKSPVKRVKLTGLKRNVEAATQ